MYGYPATFRIKRKKDFAVMQSNGRKLFTPLVLIVVSKPLRGVSRLGVIVSKRVDKRAVVRNRIKRYFREIFRLERENLIGPLDVVLIARQEAVSSDFKTLRSQIVRELRRKHYLKEEERNA